MQAIDKEGDKMKKLVINWNKNFKGYETIAFVISILCSVIAMVFTIFQITGLMEKAINIAEPLLGVMMVAEGIMVWKKNKLIALFSFGVALFIFTIAVHIFMRMLYHNFIQSKDN